MAEWRLFEEGTVPECTTAEWYLGRERAPHLEQAGHRDRLLKADKFIVSLFHAYPELTSVVDLGCGDGGLLSLLKAQAIRGWGYDLSPAAVAGARERGVDAEQLDVVARMDMVRWADLAVTTEMLEHLVDPHRFLRRLACTAVVASSPVFETDLSHYEFHTWAWDIRGYLDLFEQAGFSVVRHETVQSFQVISAVR